MSRTARAGEIGIDDVVRLLNRLNLRITPQRIFITKVILENIKKHPSFKEIYEIVKRDMPSIGVSTLFNTLKVLERHGVIVLFEYNGETHIDLPGPHVNVHCEDTGEIVDFEDNEINEQLHNMIEKLSEKGVDVKNAIVIIKGRCRGLQRAGTN